jgi:antitoxin (DNA-binding transcriptional repressor) of toxin-antitoxin stability system
MPATITLEEAQARLPELVASLGKGQELLIIRNERPVAKLVGQGMPERRPRRPGSARGKLVILAEDEEHLKDFEEYME